MLSSKLKRPIPGSRSATPNATQPEATHAEVSSTSLKKKARKTVFSTLSKNQDKTVIATIDAVIPVIEDGLLRLKARCLEKQENALFIPLQAKPNLQSSDDALFPLMEKALEFLAGPGLVFLLLGDSGGGKSTFNLQLERTLWNTYKRGDPIPLHINLPSIDNPQQDIIGKQLRQLDFSDTQIMELKHKRQLIAICDGYDESQLATNIHTTNVFNQPGQWKVKMIVTCRTQYLGPDYYNRFVPLRGGPYGGPAPDLFQEAVIAPFTKEHIQRYVDIYVPLEPRTWCTQDYMDTLTTIPNLLDLVSNPFLLSLALEALPGVTEGQKSLSTIKISRVQLYDTFVRHWFEVNQRRLEGNKALSKENRDTLNQLVDAGFVSLGVDYSARLAEAIFDMQDGNPIVQYVQFKDKNTWKAKFFGIQPEIRLLKESSPLTRTGNQFRFVHRSMLEYFLSRVIYSQVRTDKQEFDQQADSVSPVAPSVDTNGSLFRRNLIPESSVIQFLCDRVKSSPNFEQELRGIVDLSKTDASATIAATNAITILIRAGALFNGADLRGIKIPGADLSDGQFDSAQFQGADLRDANLPRSWLRQADLSGARLEGVRFGELPYLEMDHIVAACSYSPDGKMLAVTSFYEGFQIYDTSTWTIIHQFPKAKWVRDITFSPNNQQIVSAGEDGSVRMWGCVSGEEILSMSGHSESVRSVAFSPCGKQIASASDDSTVRLWESQTGERSFILEGHTKPVFSVKYSPDGRQLVSGGKDETIRFWDPASGKADAVLSPLLGVVPCLAYSPDGRWVASGHNRHGLRLWDAATKEPGPVLSGHSDTITWITFSPSGQWISSSSSSYPKAVTLLDASTGALVSMLTGHDDNVACVAFSPDGFQIASSGWDKKLRLWEVGSAWPSPDLRGGVHVGNLSYALDGLTIRACAGGVFLKWDAGTGVSCESNPWEFAKPQAASCMEVTRDDSQLATGYKDGSIRLWDRQTSAAGAVLEGNSSGVLMLVYSLCRRWIVSVDEEQMVRLWDLHIMGQPRVLDFGGYINDVAFSPAGDQIAVGVNHGTVRLFDLPIAGPPTCCKLTKSSLVSIVYSPNGRQIAIRAEASCIYLWDLQSEKPSAELEGNGSWVRCVAYSPCGQWIALGSDDNTVGIWHRHLSGEVESWSKDYSVCSFFAVVYDIAWNPVVPMEFVTRCKDRSVRVWRVSHGDGGNIIVKMLWGSNLAILHAESLLLENTIGLSPVNRKLLTQRGAISPIGKVTK